MAELTSHWGSRKQKRKRKLNTDVKNKSRQTATIQRTWTKMMKITRENTYGRKSKLK